MREEVNRYIRMWERRCYSDGLPDEAPAEIDDMVPSYKRIAIAVLKNDLSYIGIEPPKSEYYSILKCIELGIVYKKSKTMTQQELKQFTFHLINTMVKKQSYIKGYGTLYRVMDKEHNPVQNITKQQFQILQHNGILQLAGMVWQLNVLTNPFAHAADVKLPTKIDAL